MRDINSTIVTISFCITPGTGFLLLVNEKLDKYEQLGREGFLVVRLLVTPTEM